MIIDAKDMIVGRIATVIAKKALLGEKVDVLNCEQAFVTGKRSFLVEHFKRKRDMGTFKGPFIPRMPDRLVRRIIRGMLPYKQERGRNAFERIMCYIGIPKEFEGKKMIHIKEANISKVSNMDYMKIEDICNKLGKM